MDRNVVIATVLIAVIMFVWLWWLSPPPPAQPTAQEDPVADSQQVVPPPLPDTEAVPELPPVQADTTIAGAQEGTERFITVDTDLYEARFSTKGATLVSFVLKEYDKFDQETPVELVNPDYHSNGALALAFTTPQNHLVDTRSFYFEPGLEGDTLRVGEEAPAELTFTAQVGAGMLRQTYVFQPGEYEIQLQVDQENPLSYATREGYEVVWDGGIPFTEGDPEDEARYSGAFARSGGEVESVGLDSDAYEEQVLSGEVSWVSVKNKFFSAVLMPESATRGAELIGERQGDPDGAGPVWEDYTVRLAMPLVEAEPDVFRLYIGPMEFYRITDYDLGLYDMVDYGWDYFEWMTRPLAKFVFIPAFTFLSTFIPNYGLVIIVFAIIIKLLLYPLTRTSYRSMARMRELQPKMEAIKEKYGDNPQKQQEAMMKMYRETGINPLGGCMPMLLQYPIIIALWQYLPQSLEIRQAGFLWAEDLSAPDVILNLPFTIPFYGDFVAGFTLLMGLSMVVQMRIQMNPSTNPQAKIFTFVMPVMLFLFFNRLASGLSLYYLCYNVVSAVQQKFINKSMEEEQEGTDGKGTAKDAKTARKRGAADKKRGGRNGRGGASKRVRT